MWLPGPAPSGFNFLSSPSSKVLRSPPSSPGLPKSQQSLISDDRNKDKGRLTTRAKGDAQGKGTTRASSQPCWSSAWSWAHALAMGT